MRTFEAPDLAESDRDEAWREFIVFWEGQCAEVTARREARELDQALRPPAPEPPDPRVEFIRFFEGEVAMVQARIAEREAINTWEIPQEPLES